VTGCVFPVAAGALLAAGHGAAGAAGAIESSDHAGATIAALFAAVLFVPVFGLHGTALLVAALQVISLAVALGVPALSNLPDGASRRDPAGRP